MELLSLISSAKDLITKEYLENEYLPSDLGGREESTEAEFTFRAVDGTDSVKDGYARIKSLKGNSLVWNQKTRNGDFSEGITNWSCNHGTAYMSVSDGELSVIVKNAPASNYSTYVYQSHTFVSGHKYLIALEAKCPRAGTMNIDPGAFATKSSSLSANVWTPIHSIGKASAAGNKNLNFYPSLVKDGYAAGDTFMIRNINCFDLTMMFGAGNEPATIDEFKALFPRAYYAYNAGEIIHFNGRRLLTTGFNQFNGTYAKVIGGNAYYFTGTFASLGFAEEEGGELTPITLGSSKLYTPPTDGYIYAEGEDICINLSWSGYRNGEYEPYEEHILELPYGVYGDGLKSAGTAYDEVTEERYVKRIGAVKMKDIRWARYTSSSYGNTMFQGTIAGIKIPTTTAERKNGLLIRKYPVTSGNANTDELLNASWVRLNTEVYIKDDAYADASAFMASLTDDDVIFYELAEPVVTEFGAPLNLDYEVSDFGTEMLIPENGAVPTTTPIKASIVYNFNAVDTIRNNKFKVDALKKELDSFFANPALDSLRIGDALLSYDTENDVFVVDKPVLSRGFIAGEAAAGGNAYVLVDTMLAQGNGQLEMPDLETFFGLSQEIITGMLNGAYNKVIDKETYPGNSVWDYTCCEYDTLIKLYFRQGDGFDIENGVSIQIDKNTGMADIYTGEI